MAGWGLNGTVGLKWEQIVPALSNGIDAINFRNMKESKSLQLEAQGSGGGGAGGQVPGPAGGGGMGAEDGLEPLPEGERDLFGGFSSVTLKYDGEDA